jgi:hypothetical protein
LFVVGSAYLSRRWAARRAIELVEEEMPAEGGAQRGGTSPITDY